MVRVPVGLAEPAKTVRRFREEAVLIRRKRRSVRIQPVTIGANVTRPDDLPQATASLDSVSKTVIAVTLEARLLIDRRPSCNECLVHGIRVWRGRQRPDPVAHALQARVVDRRRCDPRAESRTQIALVDRVVVTVPVELHAFARLLIPE